MYNTGYKLVVMTRKGAIPSALLISPLGISAKVNAMYQLYIIKSSDNIHKIGISSDAKRRLNEMQTDNHQLLEIVLIATFTDESLASKFEYAIHILLNNNQIHGEWFQIDTYIIGSIVALLEMCGAVVEVNTILSSRQFAKRTNGHGYAYASDASENVRTYLANNPDDIFLPVRELAEKIGVGKSTVAAIRKQMIEGNN